MSVVGTRPEMIKMAPVIRELDQRKDIFDHILVTTAQHREMFDQVLSVFKIRPDIDLGLMRQDQRLAEFASRSLSSVSKLLLQMKPDLVLVQGDTTTAMTAALAAFYEGVSVGHVEAGLRSFDQRNPFPEETNRTISACLADIHFAPTERARYNLLREGVAAKKIFVTGNTVVDALRFVACDGHFDDENLNCLDFENRRLLLLTAHRRENHGLPLRSICQAMKMLLSRFGDIEIVYPVHLNPNVGSTVRKELANTSRIHLVNPVSYRDLLRLMDRCYLILTDSGGIQEEAPSFHKPVLVLREITERPELIEFGAGKIVGTDPARIVKEVTGLLTDRFEYEMMSTAENPFGDGHAAERIVNIIAQQQHCAKQREFSPTLARMVV